MLGSFNVVCYVHSYIPYMHQQMQQFYTLCSTFHKVPMMIIQIAEKTGSTSHSEKGVSELDIYAHYT